jgi:hypothetical protein
MSSRSGKAKPHRTRQHETNCNTVSFEHSGRRSRKRTNNPKTVTLQPQSHTHSWAKPNIPAAQHENRCRTITPNHN